MTSSYVVLFGILGLIVLALSVYLGVLYGKLRVQKQAKLAQDKKVEQLLKSVKRLSLKA